MGSTTVRLEDLVREQALMLGAGSTVCYQLARKGVGLGVAEHSTTLTRPFDRLRTTLTYVDVMILGSDEERRAITRLVNRAHAPVRSEGRYSAYDPDLQLWVAATLAHNAIFVYEKVWGPLDPAGRERIYRDSQIFGNALQVRPEQWPATTADFETYWDRTLDALEPEPTVQRYCRALLDPHGQPRGLRRLAPLQDLMTRGNLDPRARDVLGLTWNERDQRRYDRFWQVFRPLYRAVPVPLRRLPTTVVMWDVRRRLRTGARVI
ncbi:oxygenase MpaB family protein [Nocardioides sp. CER19]|uniref:oxygenase MpaB family protein n=1 Tax=Nocardioides sp. CER19 TaxID=3038538 RepID=UPI002448FF1A|nr:oxygenase MpaB family protein [Nocardioides sp. CER19]MDH2413080.1 oxygenase MpaB family protein [Nocardioides sp. CER19]